LEPPFHPRFVIALRAPGDHPTAWQERHSVATNWSINGESLSVRSIQSTGLILQVMLPSGPIAVALDPTSEQFVHLPGLLDNFRASSPALSVDGRRVLSLQDDLDTFGRVRLHEFPTGLDAWFDVPSGERACAAALDPDSATIAILTTSDVNPEDPEDDGDEAGGAQINLIHIESGETRRLWAAAGGWSDESTINWSPDGRWIAAGYTTMEDDWAVVVVDPSNGKMVQHCENAALPSAANGAWLDATTMLYGDQNLQLHALDVATGATRFLGSGAGIPFAVVGDWLVLPSTPHPGLSTRPIQGGAVEPRIMIESLAGVRGLDLVPGLDPLGLAVS
jgi:hypothetical protein